MGVNTSGRPRRRNLLGLAAIVLAPAACAGATTDVVVRAAPVTTTATRATPPSASPTTPATTPGRSTTPTTTSGSRPTTTAPTGTGSPPTTAGGNRGTGSGYQDQLNTMIDDIRAWWTTTFPAVYAGKPFKDLTGGIIRVTSDNVQVPACGGGRPPRYRDVAGNAYYCREAGADYIAYDDSGLGPKLQRKYGTIALGLVLAHEYGHAIQARANVDGQTILLEQQADCFAGAWLAHVATNKPSGIPFSEADLNGAMGGFLSYSDPVGTTAQQQGAHGSGFDRVGALQDGYSNGARKCVTYANNLPPILALPFRTTQDYQNGGNLPYDEVQTYMVDDLDRYWSAVLGTGFTPLAPKVTPTTGATCNGRDATEVAVSGAAYCADTGSVVADDSTLRKVYDEGDFAVGFVYGHAWAEAAQKAEGSKLKGKGALLQADCYVGAWTRSTIAELKENENRDKARTLTLSPGDLDEGIRGLLTYGSVIGTDATAAGPFDRVAAFRQGVLGGLKACPT